MERACAPFAAQRRTADHLATMRAEIHRQAQPGLSDESWCASDVSFHRALVDAAQNPVMSYQLAGSVEAMQPLMNMITFTARNRETIIRLHSKIANHLDNKEAEKVEAVLVTLSDYTKTLAYDVIAAKQKQKDG
jgi:DNA-binding FadR family transcriptional regulator